MRAMIILRRCRAAQDDIRSLDQRIERWRDVLTSIGTLQADPNGGSRGSGDRDRYGRIMADMDLLEREKARREEAWEAEKVSCCALLDMVPDLESDILHAYYVNAMDTGAIARAKHMTPGYIRKTKRNAEQLLDMVDAGRVAGTLPAWYLREYPEE